MHIKDTYHSPAAVSPSGEEIPTSVEKESNVEEVETKGSRPPDQDEAWLAAEKSLVRKLDFTLVPMIWVLYLFNYLDRNNIA